MIHTIDTGRFFFTLRKAPDGGKHEIGSEICKNLEKQTGAENERNDFEGSHS